MRHMPVSGTVLAALSGRDLSVAVAAVVVVLAIVAVIVMVLRNNGARNAASGLGYDAHQGPIGQPRANADPGASPWARGGGQAPQPGAWSNNGPDAAGMVGMSGRGNSPASGAAWGQSAQDASGGQAGPGAWGPPAGGRWSEAPQAATPWSDNGGGQGAGWNGGAPSSAGWGGAAGGGAAPGAAPWENAGAQRAEVSPEWAQPWGNTPNAPAQAPWGQPEASPASQGAWGQPDAGAGRGGWGQPEPPAPAAPWGQPEQGAGAHGGWGQPEPQQPAWGAAPSTPGGLNGGGLNGGNWGGAQAAGPSQAEAAGWGAPAAPAGGGWGAQPGAPAAAAQGAAPAWGAPASGPAGGYDAQGFGQQFGAAASPARPVNTRPGVVVVKQGKEPGRVFEIRNDRLTIGRSRDSDIFLEDLAVSRLHATVFRDENGEYRVRDENSANGTTVNGQRITEHLLQEGDEIVLGQTVLAFARR